MKDKKGREIVEYLECPECKQKLTTKRSLTTHLKNVHNFAHKDLVEHKQKLAQIITITRIEANKKQSISKNIIGEDGLSIAQRGAIKAASTKLNDIDENGYNGHKRGGLKARATITSTILENGLTIAQNTGKKMARARKADIDENGLNSFQRCRIESIRKMRETICEDGMSLFEKSSMKSIQTRKNTINEDGLSICDLTGQKMAETRKKLINEDGENSFTIGAMRGAETKLKRNPDTFKEMGRKSVRSSIEQHGKPMVPNIGKNETKILDELEKEKNIKITRQFCVKGFWVDGYDEENNVVYEVNERYHYANEEQIQKDKYRREVIVEALDCEFIIIDDL